MSYQGSRERLRALGTGVIAGTILGLALVASPAVSSARASEVSAGGLELAGIPFSAPFGSATREVPRDSIALSYERLRLAFASTQKRSNGSAEFSAQGPAYGIYLTEHGPLVSLRHSRTQHDFFGVRFFGSSDPGA